MCSDGIIDSNGEYQNKELWLKYLLEEINKKKKGKNSHENFKKSFECHSLNNDDYDIS